MGNSLFELATEAEERSTDAGIVNDLLQILHEELEKNHYPIDAGEMGIRSERLGIISNLLSAIQEKTVSLYDGFTQVSDKLYAANEEAKRKSSRQC